MLAIQSVAGELIGRVLGGSGLDRELRDAWQRTPGLSPHERAAIQDACYGTLRFLSRVDAMLAALLDKPLKDERLRNLLRVALYQLEYTRAAPHAVVDFAVRGCTELGLDAAKGLTNAVLRNFMRRRAEIQAAVDRNEVARYAHPQWWIDKLRAEYPDDYARVLLSANGRPPLTLRVNRRKITVDAYLAQLAALGMAARAVDAFAVILEQPVPVERVPGFTEGLVSVQDAAAQRAATAIDLHPGQRVLDACAAPGGKTAHMLELCDIDLTALDNDAERLKRVQANLDRLGLAAKVVCGDAAGQDAVSSVAPFDRILADVPCSASGVVRRHPDIKWLRRAADIAQFAQRQQQILDALWQSLAGDGKLLYATCSVFQEENNAQVERFLERHADARRLTLPGADTQAQMPSGQILPDEQHDGFFYALLQKT
jgi:16S rRNA (cytosine967-C5)-methyltransferase